MDSLLEWKSPRTECAGWKGTMMAECGDIIRLFVGEYDCEGDPRRHGKWFIMGYEYERDGVDTYSEAQAWAERECARRLMEVPAVRELVEAGRDYRRAEWHSVGVNSSKMADRIGETDLVDAAKQIVEMGQRLDKALGVFGGEDA